MSLLNTGKKQINQPEAIRRFVSMNGKSEFVIKKSIKNARIARIENLLFLIVLI